jgi:pre-mRNA-splicing factor SYF2
VTCELTHPDANDDAAKKYDRSIRNTKVDLVGYNRKKEAALGLAPGTLVPLGTTSDQLAAAGPSRATNPGLSASEDLYRDKDPLSYGDSKPSEDAVDRVIGNINEGCVQQSECLFIALLTIRSMSKKRRNRKVEETEVNYINKRNKHFNKKAARYFDKYTTECVYDVVV